MSSIITSHIEIDEDGVAWIADTRVKVVEIAVDKIAHGSSPEEMRFQYPHLTLAQIHAALAYYYDNQAVLDAEIKKRWLEADELATRASDAKLRQRLVKLKDAANKKQLPARSYRKSKDNKGTAKRQSLARSYRRRKGHDTWHWCRDCSTSPTSDYEEKASSARPTTGELCNECQAKEKTGHCHAWE